NGIILQDLFPVIGQKLWLFDFSRSLFQISHQDFFYLCPGSDFIFHVIPLHFQDFIDTGSHCSQPQKGYINHFFAHSFLPFLLLLFLHIPSSSCCSCSGLYSILPLYCIPRKNVKRDPWLSPFFPWLYWYK